MSVVGFDIGNLNSVIAVARNRGVDIICNEVSNRATPTLVSFGQRNRFVGESAKTQEVGNFRNTAFGIKRLLGMTMADREFIDHERKFLSCDLLDRSGQVAIKVNYLGEEREFTSIELAAMVLARLKETAEADVGRAVTDVVIAVPCHFTDRQRRAVLDAADIAGLTCLRLINETTASALAYGMPKMDLPEDQARTVCFVDMGHASTSVSVAAFTKSKMEVKATAFNRCFGGRDFDEAMAQHFCDELARSKRMDVRSSKRALFRLRSSCERTKKVLSANAVTRMSVEALMDDIDVSVDITRDTFESLIGGLVDKLDAVVKECLQRAGLQPSQIDVVEVVGGSTRIPAVKARLVQLFGRDISTTLNPDEAVARGAALQCAIVSPVFKVREYAVHEAMALPVRFSWEPTPDQPDDVDCEVFPVGNAVPSTKLLSFQRPLPFSISFGYSAEDGLPSPAHRAIGAATIGESPQAYDAGAAEIKVKVRANPHGIVGVEGAYISEPAADGEKQRRIDLPVQVAINGLLGRDAVQGLKDAESEMAFRDRLVAETSDRKNALEEYIYEMRAKLEGAYAQFIAPRDAERLSGMMAETESWLYGEGADTSKGVYAQRLEALQAIGQPVRDRAREWEERPRAEQRLRDVIAEVARGLDASGGPYEHLDGADREKLAQDVQSKRSWIDAQVAAQAKTPAFERPVLTVAAIEKHVESLRGTSAVLLAKSQRNLAAKRRADEEAMRAKQGVCEDGQCQADVCCPGQSSRDIPSMDMD